MFTLETQCVSGIQIQQLICFPLKSDILIYLWGAYTKERWGQGQDQEEEAKIFKGPGTGPGASVTGPDWPSLALALSSCPRTDCMRDLLEPLSQRKAFQEGQGTTANFKLFALHELLGAQAPFLVNILDGRPKNNNTFPQVLQQSQEHLGRLQPLRRTAPGT